MQQQTDAAAHWSAGIWGYLRAFSFPFAVPGWPRKLWWLPLVAVIPLVDVVLMRGWRTEVVRRMGRGNPDPLPDLRDFGRFVKDGLWLWLMTAIYFVPQAILLFFFGAGAISMAITIGRWLIAQLSGEPTVSLGVLLAQLGFNALANLIIPLIYPILTYPLFRIATVRFALLGWIGAFFDLLTNLRLAGRHFGAAVRLFLLEYLTTAALLILGGMAATTVVGAVIVPLLLFPMLYWSTGHLFGRFAQQISADPLAGQQVDASSQSSQQ